MKGTGNLGNKQTFAKNLQMYMDMNGKSRNDICVATGIKYSTLTEWLNAKKYPRIDKIELLADYFGIEKSDLIEEKATDETKKKSKVAVDLTKKLGSDKEFAEVVIRMYEDNDFFELTKMLSGLTPEQIESVKNMLGTFFK